MFINELDVFIYRYWRQGDKRGKSAKQLTILDKRIEKHKRIKYM